MSPLILAVVSGVGFTFIGIAYRLGQPHGISPIRIALGFAVIGTVFFGVQGWAASPPDVPLRVLVFAVIVGAGQYVTLKFVRIALARGPMAPFWCAAMLGFVPVTVYARLFLDEGIVGVQYAGIAAGILCVVAGSLQQRPAEGAHGVRGSRIMYGLILFVLLITNSLSLVAINDLGAREAASGGTMMDVYGTLYYALYCLTIGVLVGLDLWLRRHGRVSGVRWAAFAILAAAGWIGGLVALKACAEAPAAMISTVNNISSILAGTAAAVVFFRERATPAFFVMVALGVLAVVLVNYHALM